MRKKNIIRLLRSADENTTEQLSRDYPGLTDKERDTLYERIGRELQQTPPEDMMSEAEKTLVTGKFHFWEIFQKTAAAACVLVLCGTFAGLFWMRSKMELPSQPEPTVFSDIEKKGRIYSVGERFAAGNLTKSGRLWITVTDTESEGDLLGISVVLESENAVSAAGNYSFMLDNLMAASGRTGESWTAKQPCDITRPGQENAPFYTVSLHPGEKQEVKLWYRFRELPEELMLVTSYSSDYPYCEIGEYAK